MVGRDALVAPPGYSNFPTRSSTRPKESLSLASFSFLSPFDSKDTNSTRFLGGEGQYRWIRGSRVTPFPPPSPLPPQLPLFSPFGPWPLCRSDGRLGSQHRCRVHIR